MPEWYDPEDEYIVYGGVLIRDGRIEWINSLAVARALLLPTSARNVRLAQDLGSVTNMIQGERGRSRSRLLLHGPQEGEYDGDRWIPFQLAQVRAFLLSCTHNPRLHGGLTEAQFNRWAMIESSVLSGVTAARAGQGWSGAQCLAYLRRVASPGAEWFDPEPESPTQVGMDLADVPDVAGMVIRDAMGNIIASAAGRLPMMGVATVHDSVAFVPQDQTIGFARMTKLPAEGSKPWRRIQAKGCVGKRNEQGEFECPDYAWDCERCPAYTGEKWEPGSQHRLKRLMKSISKKD